MPHERLPDVVVRMVRVLVIRRVEICHVDHVQARRKIIGVAAYRATTAGQHRRNPQLHWIERPRRPCLEVRHLQAGRGVHPIRRFEERRQEDRPLHAPLGHALDFIANGIYAAPIEGLEVPRFLAERACEIAVTTRKRVEVRNLRGQRPLAHATGVRLHVRGREHFAVCRDVVGGHVKPRLLESLRHPRRAREQVERRRRRPRARGAPGVRLQRRCQLHDARHQRALGPDVLDHRRAPCPMARRNPVATGTARCSSRTP